MTPERMPGPNPDRTETEKAAAKQKELTELLAKEQQITEASDKATELSSLGYGEHYDRAAADLAKARARIAELRQQGVKTREEEERQKRTVGVPEWGDDERFEHPHYQGQPRTRG